MADQPSPPPGSLPPDVLVTGSLQPLDPRAVLVQRALQPVIPNVAPRCPRCGIRLLTDGSRTCPRCKVDPQSVDAAALLVPEGSWLKELLRGAGYVPRGFWTILTKPRLWPAAALPLFLNIVIFALLWYLLVAVVQKEVTHYASAEALENWKGFWWGFLALIVKFIGTMTYYLSVVMIPLIMAWLMAAFPFSIVFRAIFTPFAAIVSERTEQIVLDLPEAKEKFDWGKLQTAIVTAILDTIFLALVQALLMIILLVLNVIPFVGQFLWLVLPPAIMAGMDHTDPTLCRKTYLTREKVALWKLRHWRFLGFGMAFFFLLGVPFVNAFMFPVIAAGGSLLYIELDRK